MIHDRNALLTAAIVLALLGVWLTVAGYAFTIGFLAAAIVVLAGLSSTAGDVAGIRIGLNILGGIIVILVSASLAPLLASYQPAGPAGVASPLPLLEVQILQAEPGRNHHQQATATKAAIALQTQNAHEVSSRSSVPTTLATPSPSSPNSNVTHSVRQRCPTVSWNPMEGAANPSVPPSPRPAGDRPPGEQPRRDRQQHDRRREQRCRDVEQSDDDRRRGPRGGRSQRGSSGRPDPPDASSARAMSPAAKIHSAAQNCKRKPSRSARPTCQSEAGAPTSARFDVGPWVAAGRTRLTQRQPPKRTGSIPTADTRSAYATTRRRRNPTIWPAAARRTSGSDPPRHRVRRIPSTTRTRIATMAIITSQGFASTLMNSSEPAAVRCRNHPLLRHPPVVLRPRDARPSSCCQLTGVVHCVFVFGPVGPLLNDGAFSPHRPVKSSQANSPDAGGGVSGSNTTTGSTAPRERSCCRIRIQRRHFAEPPCLREVGRMRP